MSILGTLVDKQTISFCTLPFTLNLKGMTFATYNHSLPATNPEALIPVMISVASVAGNNSSGVPDVLALGGNASILTVGFANASNVSCPIVCFDLLAIVFHSMIR